MRTGRSIFASDMMGKPIQCFFVYERICGVIVLGKVSPDYYHECVPVWSEFYDGVVGLMLWGYMYRLYVLIGAFVCRDDYSPRTPVGMFVECGRFVYERVISEAYEGLSPY